jgi:hypothetical protein
MVIISPGFDREVARRWAGSDPGRYTVLFPSGVSFYGQCLKRVLREVEAGMTVLAWGDAQRLSDLVVALERQSIPVERSSF